MNNFLDFRYKILYNFETINKIEKNISAFPIHLTVSLTNLCNHRCLWCTVYKYQKKNIKELKIKDFLKFLKIAKKSGLKAITYVGNGEPTVYTRFRELVKEVTNIGTEQAMFTNGYLIDKYEEEILNYFTWIRISLDAGSEKIHNLTHGVNKHFKKILNNIENLIKKRNGVLPTIGVQFAFHQINIADLYNTAKLCKDMGVDYFSIKPVFNRGAVGERLESNKIRLKEVKDIVAKIKKDFENDKFLVFFRPYQVISNVENENILNYKKCFSGFFNLNIYEDGNIYICGPQKIKIGNIFQKLEEISKNVLEYYQQIDLKKCPAGCRYHPLNYFIYELMNKRNFEKKTHINFI